MTRDQVDRPRTGTSGPARWRRAGALVTALALAAAACASGDDGGADGDGGGGDGEGAGTTAPSAAPLPEGYEGHRSELYADDANWLCRPDVDDDACDRDLDATAVHADGTTEVQPHEVADDPPVDCFYVYPTTSRDEGANSDLEPGEGEEISTIWNQVARMSSTCRVFAPIYRQITLSMIGGGGEGGGEGGDGGEDPAAVAYGDVVDAFRHYVANDSDGRGFALIGHSQGAGMLSRLITDEIDGEQALRDRLVGAYLLGSGVGVPEGEVVGGSFENVPLCEATDQVGCVVTYATFRATDPPPDNSLFGRPRGGDGVAGCVNPADPAGGGPATLSPHFLVDQPEDSLLGGVEGAQPFADPERTAEITTPYVTYPDFLTAECVRDGEFSYLELTVEADPDDPRTDDIGGDLSPEWGLHLVDANVAMGDLVAMVAAQAETYTG